MKKRKKSARRKKSMKLSATKKRVRKSTKKKETPVIEIKSVYIAPKRTAIKDAVCALLPHIDPKLIKRLDYWALYTIHQDVVKDGKDSEELARRLIRGYEPGKGLGTVQPAAAPKGEPATLTGKEAQSVKRTQELDMKKDEARTRADAAKERARTAKDKARAAAQAAKAKERAARAAARAKRLASKYRTKASKSSASSPLPAATPAKTAAAKIDQPKPAGGAYIPPKRVHIREDLARLMPMIKRSDLTGLDYWQLYTMHSEIVKYRRDPESLARKFVRGYTRRPKA
ncbi:MAG: hypothetical protein NTZ78_14465 [Candidatus Aureabacteria bacterium]|nr:hypothetical protein [Candidatus Auribacterota bacterium]